MAKKSQAETKTFAVDVKEVGCHTIEVKLPANATKEQVLAAASRKIEEGDEGNTEYDRTLDPETWNVRDDQGNYL